MRSGYKIVCNTAAGRSRYMQFLVPYVLAEEIVDRYDIWINTTNVQDIAFFFLLADKYPKVNLVFQPEGKINGIQSIFPFYKECIEEKTIYIKLDDDIIWMEPNAIKSMVDFRINNPNYFIVSPLVINNALCTYLLQQEGYIKYKRDIPAYINIAAGWCDAREAESIHNWFIRKIKNRDYLKMHFGSKPIALNRFSINNILWYGEIFNKFKGLITSDDEEFLSVVKPSELGLCNCINTDVIVVHFAFTLQREGLDKSDILSQYKEIHSNNKYSPETSDYFLSIQKILNDISLITDFSKYIIYKNSISSPKGLKEKIRDIRSVLFFGRTFGELYIHLFNKNKINHFK